ncbi:MAG: glycosyltransferase [Bryobacteraceae bacterium]
MWLLYAVCAAAAGYQLAALAAVLRQLLRRERPATRFPFVSILKPVHGRDEFFERAIASHTRIAYPEYEVLYGVNRAEDAAADAVRAVPGARLYVSGFVRPNAKSGNLMELERHAKGEVWVVNDGDILVGPEYLRRVVAPLEDPGVGLVTCLYRAIPQGAPAAWEALGIAVDFAPSTLVAPLVGINEFGLGSTLCFRAAEWKAAGGFDSISDYLADDYQLARRLTREQGKRAVMSKVVVDTGACYESWGAMWRHQVRWARTIRVSRAEYAGLPVTHAGLWALVAGLCGECQVAYGLIVLRMVMALASAGVLLRSPLAWGFLLAPVWDLFAFVVWAVGLRGQTVEWRGRRIRLRPDGRLAGDAE